MYRMQLSEREHSSLRNALIVAKERYEIDAAYFREIEPELKSNEEKNPGACRLVHSSACPRLAEQFDLQASDVGKLLEKLDELEEADL